ncbi:unnamed protein product, partial [Vitis vinifera]
MLVMYQSLIVDYECCKLFPKNVTNDLLMPSLSHSSSLYWHSKYLLVKRWKLLL